MAKIPNQNDIAKIVKANLDSIEKVIDVIVSSADVIASIPAEEINAINSYSTTVGVLFAKNGICTAIIDAGNQMSQIANIKLNNKAIRRLRQNIHLIIDEMVNIVYYLNHQASGLANMPKLNFNGFTGAIKSVIDVIALMDEDNMKYLRFKMWRVKRYIKQIIKCIGSIDFNIDTTKLKNADKGFTAFFNVITGIFDTLKKIPIIPLVYLKINTMSGIITRVVVVCNDIASISQKTLDNVKTRSKDLDTVFKSLNSIFKSIHKIWAGPLLRLTLRNISKSIALINNVLNKISAIKIKKTVYTKLAQINLIFAQISLLFIAITLLTPVWVVGMLATLILLGVIKIFGFAFNWIITMLVKLASRNAMKGMLALMLLGLLLTAIATMFLYLATIAEGVVKQSLWILGLLGVIIATTVLIAAFGFVCGLMWAPLLVAVVGLALVTVIIGLLFVIAWLLTELQKVNLDGEKIKENVDIVIGTATSIVTNIFKSDEMEDEESDKSWIASILGFIGGAIAPVIQAIMAVAYLALLTVGIGCILLIAGMLRLIQELELNQPQIEKNVDIVIDTALMVVDTIFKGPDQNAQKSNKSFLEKVLDYIGSGLILVIKAIMAVAFLAVIILAISLILLIATELRLLQILDLDPDKIKENVSIVINTASMVVDTIFNPTDREAEASSKGWIATVISWFSPELATIVQAIMAIAFLAIMIVCILFISILAKELEYLQQIQLDPELIKTNVDTVISTCQMVVNSVMDRKDRPDDPSSKGWIRKLLEWCGMGGLLQIVDAIMALAWLGMSVALINMVTMLANQLKTLQDIQLDKGTITKKTEQVCQTADAVSACVLGRKNPIKGNSDGPLGKVLRWLFPALAEAIDMMTKMKWVSGIMSTVGVVKQVADVLMTLLKLPDVTPVKTKVKYVCDTADEIVKMVTTRPGVDSWDDAKSRMNWMHRINQTVKEMNRMNPAGIKKAQRALSAHIKLIKEIKSADVTKLETSARMFEQMARFSESIRGNFKKLAESINEDLMPVLKDLKEIMEQVPTAIETNGANVSAAVASTTVAPTTANVTAQVERENPGMDKKQVEQLVQTRLREHANSAANSTASKIDELISLLKGYSGEHIVVQTV